MQFPTVLTIITATVWSAIALLGRMILIGVEAQRAPGYPSVGQMDYLIIGPFLIVICLLIVGWLVSGSERWSALPKYASGIALLATLPYLLVLGGGV